MSVIKRLESAMGWLLLGVFLTFVLYLPTWLAVGTWLYGGTHPDYWSFATPQHILPIAGVLSSVVVLVIHRAFNRS